MCYTAGYEVVSVVCASMNTISNSLLQNPTPSCADALGRGRDHNEPVLFHKPFTQEQREDSANLSIPIIMRKLGQLM